MPCRHAHVHGLAIRSMGPLEWSTLGALSLLWGGSYFFVEIVVATLSPLTLAALRVALAAVALNVALLATGRGLPRQRSAWAAFLTMGLVNNAIPYGLIAWGQIHVANGLAAILNTTMPLFTLLVAHVWTRDERLSAARLVALAVGFAGVVVMVGADTLGGVDARTLAQVAVLGAAVAYACAGVFGRRFAALLGERLAGHHGVGMGLIGLGLAAIDGRPLHAVRAAMTRRAACAATLSATRADGHRGGDR